MARRSRLSTPEAPSVPVHFRLTAKAYDATYRQATAARMSLADYLRHVVDRSVSGTRRRPDRTGNL
jgi:hypothetical protein